MSSLKHFDKLRLNSEFSKVYKDAKRWHSDGMVIFYKEGSERKVGFTASKKVGNAVKRNLAKRRMRALFYEIQSDLPDGSYVFVAKVYISQMSYASLKKSFFWSLRRLGCVH